MAATAICVCMTISHFGQKRLLNALNVNGTGKSLILYSAYMHTSFPSLKTKKQDCSENSVKHVLQGVWMRKELTDSEKCDHFMHFVWSKWKMIHSLSHVEFCFADCVQSFGNMISFLTNACKKLFKWIINILLLLFFYSNFLQQLAWAVFNKPMWWYVGLYSMKTQSTVFLHCNDTHCTNKY